MSTKPITTMSRVGRASHGPAREGMELPSMNPRNPNTTSAAPVTPVIRRMAERMPAGCCERGGFARVGHRMLMQTSRIEYALRPHVGRDDAGPPRRAVSQRPRHGGSVVGHPYATDVPQRAAWAHPGGSGG